jgi:Spy/CpxP family protein refolding chaperone
MKMKRILRIENDSVFEDNFKTKSATIVVGKGRHSISQGLFIALVLFLLTLFVIRISQAQEPFPKLKNPILRMGRQKDCWQSPHLALTEEQTKALEALQHAYTAEAMPLRRELLPLRFEFRHLLRSPDVQDKILLDRQKRISELQMKLDTLSFSYQMKARSVFTKEQLERLPEDCLPGMDKGYEMFMGIDRGPRRGLRGEKVLP